MQKKYEAMFLLKAELPEEVRKELFDYIADAIIKNQGNIISAKIWDERRRLAYDIKKSKEALYYHVEFNMEATKIGKIRDVYKLNDNIVRVMILK